MKDSYGGMFLITLVTIFVVLFMSILLLGINYTRAFKVKNETINILERKQGYNRESKKEIEDYADQMHYNGRDSANMLGTKCQTSEATPKTFSASNICIQQIDITNSEDTGDSAAYYKVTAYIYIEIPLIFNGKFLVPVSGETKTIYDLIDTMDK